MDAAGVRSPELPCALRPGARERVPSLVFIEATARPATTRAQAQRKKPVGRARRPRRIVAVPPIKPVDTISPFSPRPAESPAAAFSPLELFFSGAPLPSPYSVDSLTSIDSVLSSSVLSVKHTSTTSGGNVALILPPEAVMSEDLPTENHDSILDTPTDTPALCAFPLAVKTSCDLKAEHGRYARAMLRMDSVEPEISDSVEATSVISQSSTPGSRLGGGSLPALSVIRFARAPSRIPRLQRDSASKSAPSSPRRHKSSARQTVSDIVTKTAVEEFDDVFTSTVRPLDTSSSAAARSSTRRNSFSEASERHLTVATASVTRPHLRSMQLPALHGDIEDLATADSYLSALEALLGVTPPRPKVSAVLEPAGDHESEDEIALTPTFDSRISARLAKVSLRKRVAVQETLDLAALSHIGALEAHLNFLAARIPPTVHAEVVDTQDDNSPRGNEEMRIWLLETSTAHREEKIGYLPRLEAHLEGLLARVEQTMLPIGSPLVQV